MAAVETKPWNVQDYLTTPERQLGYLEAALEDGDLALVAAAIDDFAKARGMSGSALPPSGDPRLSVVMSMLKVLRIEAISEAASDPV